MVFGVWHIRGQKIKNKSKLPPWSCQELFLKALTKTKRADAPKRK